MKSLNVKGLIFTNSLEIINLIINSIYSHKILNIPPLSIFSEDNRFNSPLANLTKKNKRRSNPKWGIPPLFKSLKRTCSGHVNKISESVKHINHCPPYTCIHAHTRVQTHTHTHPLLRSCTLVGEILKFNSSSFHIILDVPFKQVSVPQFPRQ